MHEERLNGRKEFILFLVLLTVYAYFAQAPGPKQNANLDLTLSLARSQTVRIDEYHRNTDDKLAYGGHYYSPGGPGLSALGVGVYYAMDRLQELSRHALGHDEASTRNITRYWLHLLAVLCVAIPSALLSVLLYRFLCRLHGGSVAPAVAVLVYGLGTLALPFSTLYLGYQTATLFAFASFSTANMVRTGRLERVNLSAAGFLMGLAVAINYQMVLVGVVLFFYILASRESRRGVARYVVGGLPLVAGLAYYNYVRFGDPLELGYAYHVTWGQLYKQGAMGLVMPKLSALGAITFGPRGLFTLSPFLLLAPLGFYAMIRDGTHRAEAIFAIALLLVYLIFNAGYAVPDPMGGANPGPARLVPILPFVVMPLLFVPKGIRWLLLPLAVYGVGVMTLATALGPQVAGDVSNPLLDKWWPSARACLQCYVPTIGTIRWGWGARESLLALGGVAGLGGLAALILHLMREKPVEDRALALTAIVLALLVVHLLVACPIDIRHPRQVPSYFQLGWYGNVRCEASASVGLGSPAVRMVAAPVRSYVHGG